MRAIAKEPTLRVGQVWEDNDKRARRRRLRIVEVLPNGAVVENESTHRRTAILANRFRPNGTGYRLVEEPKTAVAVDPVGEQVTE